ncbi:Copper-transporting P-type ATPase [compost metagenome]
MSWLARTGDGKLLGMLSFGDSVKPAASAAIGQLHALGIRSVMISGDNRAAARQVLGVDVGHDDGRQRSQIGIGGGRQRAHHQQKEQRDAKRRQVGRRHLRNDVVHVAVGGFQPHEQRQQAQHAQPDHHCAISDGGRQKRGLDQVFPYGE